MNVLAGLGPNNVLGHVIKVTFLNHCPDLSRRAHIRVAWLGLCPINGSAYDQCGMAEMKYSPNNWIDNFDLNKESNVKVQRLFPPVILITTNYSKT